MVKNLRDTFLPGSTRVSRKTAFPVPAAGEIALDALRPGQGGVITGVDAEAGLKLHLLELGFVAGSPITFLMPTPFGDPNIYALRGTCIALRKSEAHCIRVKA